MSIITKLKQACEKSALYTFDYNKPMYKYQIVSTEDTKQFTAKVLKDTLCDYKDVLIKLITTRPNEYRELPSNIIVASLQDVLYRNIYWKNPNCQIYVFDIADDGLLDNEELNTILECDSLTIIPDSLEDNDITTFTILDDPQKTLIADYDSDLTYFGLIMDNWISTIQVA